MDEQTIFDYLKKNLEIELVKKNSVDVDDGSESSTYTMTLFLKNPATNKLEIIRQIESN